MSDLTRLQNRLSEAFNGSPAGEARPDRRIDVVPPSLAADDAFTQDPGIRPEIRVERRKSNRAWPYRFAGGGLLASAAVLGLGHQAGLYAVAGGLAAIGAGAVLVQFLGRRPPVSPSVPAKAPQPSPPPVPAPSVSETQQDRLWQQDEDDALHESIHDALGDIALTRDLGRRILTANATFRALTGCGEPKGRRCEDLGLVFQPGAKPGSFEVEIAAAGGPRIFAWHDVMARDPASGALVLRSIARDVTDERLFARAREEARCRAERLSAAKSRLLATVSHEIRTPLGGILGMGSLLSRTQLTPEQKSYVDGIRQSGEALGQLVEELLDFSSLEAGRLTLNPQRVAVRPFIEGVSEMLAHRAHAKGVEIAVTVSAGVPEMLEYDPARLRQVLFNVIGNAVKFTRTGGVLIRAGMEGCELVVTVADTGPGMTEEEMARIFGEFEQVGEEDDRNGGTGLGLSISARLMTELGGSLAVSSRKGEGSLFTVRLPVNAAEDAQAAARAARLQASHVLLIAPRGPAAEATVATLETLGARCRLATDEREAALALERAVSGEDRCTDIIVDHRLAPVYGKLVAARKGVGLAGLRRIFLVNPEARKTRMRGDFDAWLIRPLREQSLSDVLLGRMRGLEKRDAINDNRPVPGFTPSACEERADGLNVLLAEDDPVNALLTRTVLEKAGHRVTHVSDFGAALEAVSGDRRPDLLVTDLHMPGGSGADTVAHIRAVERERGLSRLPVMILTADRRKAIAHKALLNGADCVLEKPAAPERLLEEVAALRPA